jgi:hypothetical protein
MAKFWKDFAEQFGNNAIDGYYAQDNRYGDGGANENWGRLFRTGVQAALKDAGTEGSVLGNLFGMTEGAGAAGAAGGMAEGAAAGAGAAEGAAAAGLSSAVPYIAIAKMLAEKEKAEKQQAMQAAVQGGDEMQARIQNQQNQLRQNMPMSFSTQGNLGAGMPTGGNYLSGLFNNERRRYF